MLGLNSLARVCVGRKGFANALLEHARDEGVVAGRDVDAVVDRIALARLLPLRKKAQVLVDLLLVLVGDGLGLPDSILLDEVDAEVLEDLRNVAALWGVHLEGALEEALLVGEDGDVEV